MAVITFNLDNNSVCVLVEKDDIIRNKENNAVCSVKGDNYYSGKIFVNDEISTCIVRGERH